MWLHQLSPPYQRKRTEPSRISHHTSEEMTWKMYILSSIKGFSSMYCLHKCRAIFSLINDLVVSSISPGTTIWSSLTIYIIYFTALNLTLSQNTTLHLASSSSFSPISVFHTFFSSLSLCLIGLDCLHRNTINLIEFPEQTNSWN